MKGKGGVKRKICVITGSRAEYGLLKPLLEVVNDDIDLDLRLIVTGMHLAAEFGLTYKEIERDGFLINEKIEILPSSDTSVCLAKSMGQGMSSFAKSYQRLKPDIIVCMGDRFEIFSAAAAALVSRIPLAHLSGGELSEGVFDDAFRHAITKMSHLHFTSTETYRRRVIQLGEEPEFVFNVGEVGLDSLRKIRLLTKKKLQEDLNFKFKKHNLLVTFHPLTLEENTSGEYFQNLLSALDELTDTSIVFTKANADTGGRSINTMIDEYVSKKSEKSIAFASLGRLRYLSVMRCSDSVVGNSSSGIIEAPSLKVGTINIGDRQKGRIKAKSVIDCQPTTKSIRQAFRKLYSNNFPACLREVRNPFGDGRSSQRVVRILKECDLNNILKKKFYDLRGKR